jgi:hypothetical protein|nr:MAG TPA: hypothetical protein [Bacteriophage sp.]
MTDEKLKEMLINQMYEMDEDDVMYIWNDYAYDCRPDDVIYENNEDVLNDLFSRPSDAVRAIYFGITPLTIRGFISTGMPIFKVCTASSVTKIALFTSVN